MCALSLKRSSNTAVSEKLKGNQSSRSYLLHYLHISSERKYFLPLKAFSAPFWRDLKKISGNPTITTTICCCYLNKKCKQDERWSNNICRKFVPHIFFLWVLLSFLWFPHYWLLDKWLPNHLNRIFLNFTSRTF